SHFAGFMSASSGCAARRISASNGDNRDGSAVTHSKRGRTGSRATGPVPEGRPGAPSGSLCAAYRGPAQSLQAVRAPSAPNQPQHAGDSPPRQENMLPERSLLLAAVLSLDAPPPPSADSSRVVWLADLDPARVAKFVVPGPLSAAGRLQSF